MSRFNISIITLIVCALWTQQIKGGDHTFFKGEVSASNMFLDIPLIALTGLINQNGYIYENYWTTSVVTNSKDTDNLSSDFSLKSIFNDIGTGIKLGYKSEKSESFFNWATYGSLNYRLNQFKIQLPEENSPRLTYYKNAIHRIQIGVGIKATFGGMYQNIRVSIDFGLRYNIPIAYSGDLSDGTKLLNSGMSPIYTFTIFGGHKWMKNIGLALGLWYEHGNYKLFKQNDRFDNTPYKLRSVGINITWRKWK